MSDDTVVVDEKQFPVIQEVMLNILSNNPTQESLQMLQMLYTGFYQNQIALMHALNAETGDIDTLIVGLEPNIENGTMDSYPLAKVLSKEEMYKYLAPDGKGGFVDRPDVTDSIEEFEDGDEADG